MEEALIPATKERMINLGAMTEGATKLKVGEEIVSRPRDEGTARRRCKYLTSRQTVRSPSKKSFELRREGTLG